MKVHTFDAPEEVVRRPGEIRASAIDFKNELATGETISTQTVSVSPTGPTLGTASVSGSQVQFELTAGSTTGTFTVTCTITTNQGNTLVCKVQLVVH